MPSPWSRRRLLQLAAVPAALTLGRASAQSATIEVVIERPDPATPVSGRTEIVGWAVDRSAASGTGVVSVSVYADGDAATGTLIGDARYGLDRPDIAGRFGAPRFGASGFSLVWDASTRPAGTVPVVAYARGIGGVWGYAQTTIDVRRAAAVTTTGVLAAEVVELSTPAAPGAEVRLAVRTEPSAACVVLLVAPAGPVGWAGLEPRSADSSGVARWTFTVPPSAARGAYSVAVLSTLGQQIATARTELTIQ